MFGEKPLCPFHDTSPPRRGWKGRRGDLQVSGTVEQRCHLPAFRVQQLLIVSAVLPSDAVNNFRVMSDWFTYLLAQSS